MLRHGVPDANFTGGGQRHQLISDEEQILNANVQIEDANIGLGAIVRDTPQTYLIAIRNGHHFAKRLFARIRKVHFDGQTFDGGFNVRRCEYQLPPGRVFQAIACDKVWISDRDPIVMSFDYLHPQWVKPSGLLLRIKHQTDIVAN